MNDILKNKKGFTLIELITVIVLLAIVASFSAYGIIGIINTSKEKNYKLLIGQIISGCETYYQECKYSYDAVICEDGNNTTLGNLVKYGYIKGNSTDNNNNFTLINPNSSVNISACGVSISYSNGAISVSSTSADDNCPKTSDYSSYKTF